MSPQTYLPRIIDVELDELLASVVAVSVDGPKGVGKTATLERRAATVFRLDTPAHQTLALAEADALLRATPPVLIDEWQRVPAVWDAVRRAVDADPTRPSRYLLAGSASPANAPAHTGAGRIVSVRMRPLSLAERRLEPPSVSLRQLVDGTGPRIDGRSTVGLERYADEITRSGLPGLRHLRGRALRAQLDGYLRLVVEHDIPSEGFTVRRPSELTRWLRAYAAATATTTSQEKLRLAAGAEESQPDRRTITSYRTILEQLWIVEPLPGWLPSNNQLGRVGQAPKHHLADPAFAARLLGLDIEAMLRGEEGDSGIPRMGDGALLGRLFESLVTQSIRVYAQQAECDVAHFRTHQGREEVDLIVRAPDGGIVALEVKLGATISDDDVKHLHWLKRRLGPTLRDAVVITSSGAAYRRADGIAVVPASLLGP